MPGADFLKNQMGVVLVVAPAPDGRLAKLAEYKNVALQRGGEVTRVLTRWIFADVPQATLKDDWGNSYDHQVHWLLSGNLRDGAEFLRGLEELGYVIVDKPAFFVPLQTLDVRDAESSDNLRLRHPRAFAVARRGHPSPAALTTAVRDMMLI